MELISENYHPVASEPPTKHQANLAGGKKTSGFSFPMGKNKSEV